MSLSPEPVPDTSQAVDESFVLQPEEDIGQPPSNQLLARTITLFKMVRIRGGSGWAMPEYNVCTHEFWKDVEVKGYVASLNGSARFLLQGGYWDITYGDLHHEYMKLGPIVRLSVEKAKSWRNGTEYVMWLQTTVFAYALQEPDDDYKPAWKVVVASWAEVYATSLIFQRVSHVGLPARWWANKNCWKALQEKHGNTLQIGAGGGNGSGHDDDDDKHDKGDGDGDGDGDDDDDENGRHVAGTSSRKRRRGAGEAKVSERRQREPASKARKDKGKRKGESN
ncbi:hypothetical protein FRC08_000130 [Ceratobasidium sp. 394]|nr:hypothetical protein FRC08_000130 [Ceratobasidium sp. 394]